MNILRRGFLTAGGLGLLALPQILQAQERNNTQHKAVINIFLGGGPPHQDMWDIKDKAPTEIRGEFKPISTNVAGIQIGECFPMIASMFDKFTAIRSVVGCKRDMMDTNVQLGGSEKTKSLDRLIQQLDLRHLKCWDQLLLRCRPT